MSSEGFYVLVGLSQADLKVGKPVKENQKGLNYHIAGKVYNDGEK